MTGSPVPIQSGSTGSGSSDWLISDQLADAFRMEKQAGLKLATQARLVALAVIAVWLLVQIGVPTVYYFETIVALFAVKGIAIGAGTDIAIESSDVIVMGDRVGAIMEARAIGTLSYRKTLQNLWLALLFNGIGVPLATTGLVYPSWAMIAMAVSISAVLANSFGAGVLNSFGSAHAAATDTREASGLRATGFERATLSVPGIYYAHWR